MVTAVAPSLRNECRWHRLLTAKHTGLPVRAVGDTPFQRIPIYPLALQGSLLTRSVRMADTGVLRIVLLTGLDRDAVQSLIWSIPERRSEGYAPTESHLGAHLNIDEFD